MYVEGKLKTHGWIPFFIKVLNYPTQKYWIHQFNILLRSLCFVSLLPVAFYSWPQVFPNWSSVTLPHSSLHTFSNCLIFCGFRLWTLTFKVFHKFSIGFQSGDWLGQMRVLIPLFSNHSFVRFAVCLGSLSCWSTKFRPCPKEVAESRISLYMQPFILTWKTCNSPVPLNENIIIEQPPNLTVGMVLCFLKLVPFFCQTLIPVFLPNSATFDKSDQITFS